MEQIHSNRGILRIIFRDAGYRVGAEVGVWLGRNAEQLCIDIPGLKLYCIDIWNPYSCEHTPFNNQGQQDRNYNRARRRMAPFDAVLIRKPSMDAVRDFAEGSLDFVYIDANHDYDFVMQDLIEWSKRVRVGGMVSGHDYHHTMGVKAAVDDYMRAHNIENGVYTDERRAPSYWWVKT